MTQLFAPRGTRRNAVESLAKLFWQNRERISDRRDARWQFWFYSAFFIIHGQVVDRAVEYRGV